jgi:uncharacterized protein Yka (UPF0111/DUF47 family)
MIDRILRPVRELPARLSQTLSGKPDRFLERLRDQAGMNVAAAEALSDYMEKPSKKNAQQIRALEKEADEYRRILIDELNRTFVTPIDREDIHTLSRAIDDIADDIWYTVNEMDILDVQPNSLLSQMANLIHMGAEEIKLAMDRIPLHPGVATTHAIRAKSARNSMETLYAEALADLFRKPKDLDNIVIMLKLREIYRHLFHGAQRIADAANIIEDVVVKFY